MAAGSPDSILEDVEDSFRYLEESGRILDLAARRRHEATDKMRAMQPRLQALGFAEVPEEPAQFAAFARSALAKWAEAAYVASGLLLAVGEGEASVDKALEILSRQKGSRATFQDLLLAADAVDDLVANRATLLALSVRLQACEEVYREHMKPGEEQRALSAPELLGLADDGGAFAAEVGRRVAATVARMYRAPDRE